GEMAVRCWVGDAMVYRTLGDVDRALEAVSEDDAEQVLKTIESFAVECSINKVWTSEALAYVVDEALQVYGGYGYSKEFPAERAYRDARITRIYEGTNEINRLIIPTRLLKMTPELFDPASARRALEDDADATTSPVSSLAEERALLARAKRLAVLLLARARGFYGDALAEEQELLGHVADVTAEVYAVESALLRAEKLVAARGEASCSTQLDIARVYTSDAADRMSHSAKQVAAALAESAAGADSAPLLEAVRRLTHHPTPDTVAARRRVADAIVRAGRYHL
ncbi:MAG TPA: acyl-CoA dehydrogenase family protein, partial [Pyrinomonadaceae bacterium]|nr:acyl-CoA dehydrogenase family protein [Pyrinomonadaceae bacterium]